MVYNLFVSSFNWKRCHLWANSNSTDSTWKGFLHLSNSYFVLFGFQCAS